MHIDTNVRRRPRNSIFHVRRFAQPTLGIEPTPSFKIQPGDRVYGIGSCFARAVGYMLESLGHDVSFGGLYHRYNAFTILQTLRWTADGPQTFTREHLVQLDDGRWFDPHSLEMARRAMATPHSYDTLDAALTTVRAQLAAVGEALRSAQVMVLTLGLVEVWRDRRSGVWVNLMPPSGQIADFHDRFQVHRTTQQQNVAAIAEIFRVVRRINPALRLICSVSPIPLRASFCFDDVLVATGYGKATLRSALQEAIDASAARGASHIDYFPSFEIVSLQRNNSVFRPTSAEGKPDGLHIREEFLEHSVKSAFLRAYVGKDAVAEAPRRVDGGDDSSDALATLQAGSTLTAEQASALAHLVGELRETRARADFFRLQILDLIDKLKTDRKNDRKTIEYLTLRTTWLRERLIDMCAARLANDGCHTIAIYGAGRHTRDIAREPWESRGLRVAAILDDSPHASDIDGIPVLRPDDLNEHVDAVVVSSDAHEDAIALAAETRFGPLGIRVVRLYGEPLPQFAGSR